ncbi:MAG: bifunctional methylenetetrahydrofolate dehydrogenase/methenyltetrahydrofolate cyclohydrolase FolD [Acidobacteria bacterium]|nr:bifunctional methylenetetrahydrofolate dehydrogenase/methenyltetrahydrofolate cyclohydrolase FolD [Acidobacteriota bacterium]
MSANILDGKLVSATILEEVAAEVSRIGSTFGQVPTLATVLVGDDPASAIYVRKKNQTCEELGMYSIHEHLPATVTADEVRATLRRLNDDPDVHGILLQLPLPEGLPEEELLTLIHPDKDADGFHPVNMGRLFLGRPRLVPCTPRGIMALLDQYAIELPGKSAVVVGRSNIVGKPLALLLLQRHATITVCHSRTVDLAAVCRQADILVAAVGRPGLIAANYVRPGAVVIDVGTNRITDEAEFRRILGDDSPRRSSFEKKGSALVGDVEWRTVKDIAGYITPVPGGVGPLTIAMLMRNTVHAFNIQKGIDG